MVHAVRQRRKKESINGTESETNNGNTTAGVGGYTKVEKYPTEQHLKITLRIVRSPRRQIVLLILGLATIGSVGCKLVFDASLPKTTIRQLTPKRTVYLLGNDFTYETKHILYNDSGSSIESEGSGDDDSQQNPLEYIETEDCKLTKEWQKRSFPSCNSLHEINLQKLWYVASGGMNDVWEIVDKITDTPVALKTMQKRSDRTVELLWRYNRDALVLERLTSSPYIPTIYSFCGTSSLHEYSYYPDLGEQITWQAEHGDGGYPGNIDTTQLLRIALDVVRAVTDLHTIDGEDHATVGHGDLSWDQYIYIDGVYKLSDFNWSFFLRWNHKLNEVCPVQDDHVIMSSAPEEYAEGKRTEKADVYSMGHVLWSILTGRDIFEEDEATRNNGPARGKRPYIPEHFHRSRDPVHVALLAAIEKCWVGDPRKRVSAKEVAKDLAMALEKIEHERQSFDGIRWKYQ